MTSERGSVFSLVPIVMDHAVIARARSEHELRRDCAIGTPWVWFYMAGALPPTQQLSHIVRRSVFQKRVPLNVFL